MCDGRGVFLHGSEDLDARGPVPDHGHLFAFPIQVFIPQHVVSQLWRVLRQVRLWRADQFPVCTIGPSKDLSPGIFGSDGVLSRVQPGAGERIRFSILLCTASSDQYVALILHDSAIFPLDCKSRQLLGPPHCLAVCLHTLQLPLPRRFVPCCLQHRRFELDMLVEIELPHHVPGVLLNLGSTSHEVRPIVLGAERQGVDVDGDVTC